MAPPADSALNYRAATANGEESERGNGTLRVLDRYVGIPVVAASGLLRRRRRLPETIDRIGIVNGTAIGDTIVLSAVVRDIAAAHPEAETVLFASSAMVPLLRQIEGVTPEPIRMASPLTAIRALRRHRFDVVIDFGSWPRVEAVYAVLSGARYTVGLSATGQHRHYAFDAAVERSPVLHELDNFRLLAQVVGVTSTTEPSFRPPGVLTAASLPSEPFVVLHLWPTGVESHLKEWPSESWRALIDDLIDRGQHVVLTGGPADVARSAAFAATCAPGAVTDTAGKHSLEELADLLAAATCVVSVNTGIAHLAAAVGASTITLNGPTAGRRWGPIGPRAVGVESGLAGCGYLDFGWEYKGNRRDCMQGISPDRVLQAVADAVAA
jgi:heptosyltransferase I